MKRKIFKLGTIKTDLGSCDFRLDWKIYDEGEYSNQKEYLKIIGITQDLPFIKQFEQEFTKPYFIYSQILPYKVVKFTNFVEVKGDVEFLEKKGLQKNEKQFSKFIVNFI